MNYLAASKPKMTLWLITIIFLTSTITFIIYPLNEFLLLHPSNLTQPWYWYKLVTYPFVGTGYLNWLTNSLALVVTGYIIENRIKRNDLFIIILLSSVIGGLGFIIINQNDIYDRAIASPTMISWGYWAATIIIGIKFWKNLNLFEKIVLVLCFLSITSLFFENFGFLVGQIGVIIFVMVFILIRVRTKTITHTNT
jgi:membrane associated rhomboid family serine protease